MNKTSRKIAAVGLSTAVIAGGIGAAVGAYVADDSNQLDELSNMIEEKKAEIASKELIIDNKEDIISSKESKISELESQEPEVINNTVEKIVEVDNGNLDLVLDEVYDQDGDVEYLLDDLDEDEVDQVVDRIVFKQDTISQAEELVKNKLVEFMDDEDMFDEGVFDGYRDNDVYSLRVDKDETSIENIDFEYKDATVYVESRLKLEEDDNKLRVNVRAEVEMIDNELEIVNVEILE